MSIRFEREGRLAWVTIDRPEAMNALDMAHNEELNRVWAEFRDDQDLWVAILTGAGNKAFSAGADLKTLIPAQGEGVMEDWNFGGITRGFKTFKPIIAAVNGVALAGGLEMVLACDLRVAADHARLGLAEVKWAIIPGAGGTQRLPRAIPLARAMEMILTGDPITADEAYQLGLVNRVVSADSLMAEARSLAETLLARGPLALRAAKQAVLEGASLSFDQGLALELDLFSKVMRTEDAAEGPRAFAEKRSPKFQGR
ncbi:MAG: enoyl-CoA hydratase-related protein [Arenicellales bacterium]|jgi:enoyl-CoA hydratase/carnithine racemase|nr:enoyl-CoA hydratase [Acidiferrobacteraceae bacterium]MDP6135902.1 enoyl-CoA hydratase-related protein [Arenicellales bacterium]MDP6392295.1 enoyl-CoA hydratase-related protein [Arenicellales bacterium]MDP7218999.1 enoyl-CoA hydratase-related protein [Arenicellales bacterium]HCF74808.1 enoyl-CoA hydratase [Gammaproteobacteria bacterium]|tara:strand:+ start:11001 stop:11768 length:768 start_codon:yes stop_codon:yes gene_type:complete